MTGPVTLLNRTWSASVLCFTRWRNSGPRKNPNGKTTLACWLHKWILDLLGVARRTAPATIVFTCNFFR